MSELLFVATGNGILSLKRDDGSWKESNSALLDHRFTSVAAAGRTVLAGTANGIYRSPDLGGTWEEANAGLNERHIRWLAYHPGRSGLALAGTEPAAIFRSDDDGQHWRECPEVANLRDRHSWRLPYSPNAGAVRGFAFHGEHIYAAVEVGGLLRSDNGGQDWYLVEGSTGSPYPSATPGSALHPDVHSVLVHPSSHKRIWAATGGGLYYSPDGGITWEHLYQTYCRAVWVDPNRPGHILLGPAGGVGRNGHISESINRGETWERATAGTESVWPRHMVERFYQVENTLLAVLSNGQALATSLDTLHWRSLLPSLEDVSAVAAPAGNE